MDNVIDTFWKFINWRIIVLQYCVGFCHTTMWISHAAAAAKSLQSCPTLCNPIDGSPPGSAVPGILQARTLEWVAISFSNAWKWKVKVKSLSRVLLLVSLWISPSSWTSPCTSHPTHASRLSQSTGLSSLCHTANSHWLFILHMIMYMFQCFSVNLSQPLLPLLCPQSVLYVCMSIPALQIGSSVPFF